MKSSGNTFDCLEGMGTFGLQSLTKSVFPKARECRRLGTRLCWGSPNKTAGLLVWSVVPHIEQLRRVGLPAGAIDLVYKA